MIGSINRIYPYLVILSIGVVTYLIGHNIEDYNIGEFWKGYIVELAGVALEVTLIYMVIDKLLSKRSRNKTLPLRLEVFEHITALQIELIDLTCKFRLALSESASGKNVNGNTNLTDTLKSVVTDEKIRFIEDWVRTWGTVVDMGTLLIVASYLKNAKGLKRQIDHWPILTSRKKEFTVKIDMSLIDSVDKSFEKLLSEYGYPKSGYFQAPINKKSFEKGLCIKEYQDTLRSNPSAVIID